MQALDNDPHASHDQYQRDAWLLLQSSLARTLDDLYLVCEGDSHSELVLSTLRILEETVDDFRVLASSSSPNSTSCGTTTAAKACSCSPEASSVPAADAAAHVSKSSGLCSWSCNNGSGMWPSDAAGITGLTKCQASSRLARSSSAGNNVAGMLGASSPWQEACSSESGGLSSSTSNTSSSSAGCQPVTTLNSTAISCVDEDTNGTAPNGSGASGVPQALHHKLSSPDRLRRSPSATKAASEERHARAERLRERLAEARLARLQDQLAKQQQKAAANKAQEPGGRCSPAAARAADKHQRSSLLRAAHLRRIRAKAEDESRKVDKVSFMNSLTTAGRKADLQQRLEEGEARRAEALAAILARQQEAAANIREAAERRKQAEAERLAQLEHRQRRKQEVQAKMERERRAAVAAREVARAHAKAVVQEREAARQQQATMLRESVNVRLKQAAERRLQHLELIRERAALGKDFDRRDSFTGGASSGRQSPVFVSTSGRPSARHLRSPVPDTAAVGSGSSGRDSSSSSGNCDGEAQDNVARAAGTLSVSAESSQTSMQQATVQPAGLLPCDVFSQLQGNSQSIPAAGLSAAPSSIKSSMKGARRRMAKARHRMQQPGCCFQEPLQAQQLCDTAEGQQLLAAWVPHLTLLGVQQVGASTSSPSAGAAGAGPALPVANEPGCATAATSAAQTLLEQACDMSSKNSSATNSPRSSMSSYAGGSVSTSTFSSTVVGSPAAGCPASWALSRSSSCCDCDSQHSISAGATPAAVSGRSRTAAEEQQREALAAVVTSARAHVAKQQMLVSHLARRSGLLYRLCEEVLAACGGGSSGGGHSHAASSCCLGGTAQAQDNRTRQDRLQQARLLELLGRLLELPANLDYLLSCGQLLPAFVGATRVALDHCNSLEADEPSMMTGGAAAARLSMLLQVLVAVLEHTPSTAELISVQEQLVGFTVAAGIVTRLASVFSLFDQPMQQVARPVPPHVLQCLRLLGALTAVRSTPDELLPGKLWPCVAPNAAAIVLEMQATSMAGVLSLLTAVLLNASPSCTPAEASSRALPPNFVEAAHLVMAVLNNVCRLDLMAGQHMLCCAHHRMEFYHLISFLLSYCLSRWPAPLAPAAALGHTPAAQPCPMAQQQQQPQEEQQRQPHVMASGRTMCGAGPSSCAACSSQCGCSSLSSETGRPPGAAVLHHPIAQLLNQVLLLIGLFCVQHPSNQAMLTWGRSPSILQRLCSLPQEYLQVPELKAVLMPTLLCVCFGAERMCEIVAQHFDLQVLLHYVQQHLQQHLQQQQQQGPPGQQQETGQTRQERRRRRRAQLRQEQQVQQPAQDIQGEQQLLPAQAQQLLQQVSSCCTNCNSMQHPTTADGGSSGNATGDSSSNRSSRTSCWCLQPGRGRHAMFALCRRFPVQLLGLAASQLQQAVLGIQQPQEQSDHTQLAQQQYAAAVAAGTALEVPPSGSCLHEAQPEHQQAVLPTQLLSQKEQGQSQLSTPPAACDQPADTDPVALQLQLRNASATKLVRCEVVACS